MDQLQKLLASREKELQEIINQAKKRLKMRPEGTLRIAQRKKRVEYYHCHSQDKNPVGKYIKKADAGIARELAQKDYERKLLTTASEELSRIQHLNKYYNPDKIIRIYENLSGPRQKLVEPIVLNNAQFVKAWEEKNHHTQAFRTEELLDKDLITEKGEHVRSKSEIILADYFLHHHIPYKYEPEIYLKNYGAVHPDFILLNIRTRQEWILEHFGMMDDPDYVNKNLSKLDKYIQNGYIPGINLIITYETSEHPLSHTTLDALVKKYLV